MARKKDVDWNLPDSLDSWTIVQVAVLMDLRDELKKINRTLGCHHFLQIPTTLRAIDRNTKKKKRKKTL